MQTATESQQQFEELSKAGLKNMEAFQKSMTSMFGMPSATEAEREKPPTDEKEDEVSELREEMRRMQETLDRLASKKG